ncbi:hypothetical protein E2C01_033283 [Portunus trituberculatus]|uniref:Uncharacterized protein n=1 Tax=Portunus trituberculatus TaxID=210409 RepID=A0A5B7F218_PORTR|nr:hypothetical protein [Portunus trituberculatus]
MKQTAIAKGVWLGQCGGREAGGGRRACRLPEVATLATQRTLELWSSRRSLSRAQNEAKYE